MRGIPIIKSKLNIPQPLAVTVPERLQSLCSEIFGRQAVIITAPAGYGKTTLMVTALNGYRSKGCRVCWYRLDEEDRDLAVFYAHLVETLFPVEEGVWEEPRKHLDGCGDIFTQHQYLNALFCQEIWAFHNQRPDIITFLAFDDYQHTLDTPEIAGTVQFFLDNLPDSYRVIVSSRVETGLITGKRRLEKNILEITYRDLCFSVGELAGLLKEKYGLNPEHGLLQKIMSHTEGWPAGIILVSQMLSKGNASEAGNLLDKSGRKEMLFQYIATEVFKSVDEYLLRFLLKTAILREFTVGEAITVFGEMNAPQLLETCEKKGLFIEKVFGEATTYRFHSLFREALLHIQPQYLSPEEVKDYHLKAAAYDIEHRVFARAIEHFIACGNIDLAVELVTRESAILIAFEALDQLRLWLKLLPEEVVSGNGFLLYFKSFTFHQIRPGEALRLLEQALAIFQQADDRVMQTYTLIAMAMLYFALRNDIPGIKKIHTQLNALAEAGREQPLAGVLTVFNFVVAIWEENLARGVELSRSINLLAVGDESKWLALVYSSQMHCLAGELDLAESRSREALGLNIIKEAELLKGHAQIFYSIVLQLKDELDALPQIIDELLAIGEKHDNKLLLGFGKRVAALTCYRRHDLEGALALLDASTSFFEELGNVPMASSNKLYRCLWQCRQDNSSDFLTEAKRVLKTLTAVPSGLFLQEIGLSVLGAIAREAGDYKLAEKSLSAAIKKCKAKGARQILSGSCLHLAKLCYDTGDQVTGENCLRQAFSLAAGNKYVMFWDMHFPTLVEMAVRCIKNGIHADFAQALIARYYGIEEAESLGRTALITGDDQLKDLTAVFLARYGVRAELPELKIRVTLFGWFGITVNNIAIPETEWKTKKISGILKYLLLNLGRPVSRYQLIDAFWREANRKLGLNSLRAALFELRKVLRKYGVPLEGKGSLLDEKRDSLEVRTGYLLEVDVELFQAHFGELKKLPANKEGLTRKKIILEEMVALYRGDLIETDACEDRFFAEREQLRSIFFTSVLDLANIYLQDGEPVMSEKLLLQILAMDQYNEEACLSLLKLYIATNQRSRAVKFYSNFSHRFEKELGLKPDEKLAMVFAKSNL